MSIQSKTGRILTLVTVLMLLMLSLSGCGGSSGEETSGPDETSKVSRIYLASPFFSDTEEEAVSRAETILRDRGFEVFSPREQTYEEEAGSREWSEAVFRVDTEELRKADCMVMIYWGNYSDSGTAWESGYAFGIGKPVIIVHLGENSNLMVHESAAANLYGVEELETYDFDSMPESDYEGKMF